MDHSCHSCNPQQGRQEKINICQEPGNLVIALAGNPNTGKSTIFNTFTGLNQHTGNWPGKTVLQAQGRLIVNGRKCTLVDLPGAYSLLANSADEEVARNFLCFARPDATIVVTDATCLERNLNLVLQVLEITDKVVVCVNLMDEAKRKKIDVQVEVLAEELGVPVVAVSARRRQGLDCLLDTTYQVATGNLLTNPRLIRYDREIEVAIAQLVPRLEEIFQGRLKTRWVALRLLEGDRMLLEAINEHVDRQAAPVQGRGEVLWAR